MSNWREDLGTGMALPSDISRAHLEQVAPWVRHPQAIRAVFFDAGFTLIHPNPSIAGIVERVCARDGIAAPADAVRPYLAQAEQIFFTGDHILRGTWADNEGISLAWLGFFQVLVASFVPATEPARLRRCASAVLAEFDSHTAWQLYDDVIPTLEALHGHYTLGVISDWGVTLGAILRELGLNRYFDFLVVSATTRRAKPDPHLFDLALQRADALGEYSVYVGDTYVQDILGARGAQINPVFIDRRRRLRPEQVDCALIATLTDLLVLLERDPADPPSP